MDGWEYEIVEMGQYTPPSARVARLNMYGAGPRRWELVAVTPIETDRGTNIEYTFKRRKNPDTWGRSGD